MTRAAVAAAILALALLTWLQFPGHTWLQQDSQIYTPILENLHDPAALRNDLLVQHPHVAFTLYDEAARFLRAASGQGFREVLAAQQIATRALGIWGLYLMATALGLTPLAALSIAAICSLGITISGPAVLTIEYEPTPRAFAVPLLVCAMGLTAHRRYLAAGCVAACAFLYHAPTTWPFLAVFVGLAVWRREWRALVPLAAALAILAAAAAGQSEQTFFARLTPLQEQLQRMRAAYSWISTWSAAAIYHWILLLAACGLAFTRIHRKMPMEVQAFALGLPLLAALAIPASWALLEGLKWALMPQVQPMRALLFVSLMAQFLAAAAALMSRRRLEAFAWFSFAFLLSLQPLLTGGYSLRRTAVALGLGALAMTARFTPIAALAAFFAIPMLGGVVNYPRLHTPEVAQLAAWARENTPPDAIFLFPDAGHALDPGIFRSEALRAVYVDWKGGGQVNYIREFTEQWWFRWQLTMLQPINLPKYEALGIGYIAVRPEHRLDQPAAYKNAKYVVYRVSPAVLHPRQDPLP